MYLKSVFSKVYFLNYIFPKCICSKVKGPVAADNARNTSSLVGLHPRQLPWASHLLHYDASSTNIILNLFKSGIVLILVLMLVSLVLVLELVYLLHFDASSTNIILNIFI